MQKKNTYASNEKKINNTLKCEHVLFNFKYLNNRILIETLFNLRLRHCPRFCSILFIY